jgi:hypothetical protein
MLQRNKSSFMLPSEPTRTAELAAVLPVQVAMLFLQQDCKNEEPSL